MFRKFVVAAVLAGVLVLPAAAQAQPIRPSATVPILVLKAKSGATAAFAPVVIHGRAYPFLIDTGATVTMVNPAIARQAHLKTVGRTYTMCGVTGCSPARRVRLRNWSTGGQPLPNVVVSSAPIAGIGGHAFGLLGSDVLSQFGSVTINYAAGQLVLG